MTSSYTLNEVNRMLERRYGIEDGYLDQFEFMISKKMRESQRWIPVYLVGISTVIRDYTDEKAYDQFSIVRLYNKITKEIEKKGVGDHEDVIWQEISVRYDKIVNGQLCGGYMDELERVLTDDYHSYARMRTNIDLANIDRYIRKHPEYHWNFSFTELFEHPTDPYMLAVISKMESLLRRIESLPDPHISSIAEEMNDLDINQ